MTTTGLLPALTIATTAVAAWVFFRIAGRGYYAAILPGLSCVMYLLLELDWTATEQGTNIGFLRDAAWYVVELGVIGGSALVAWALVRDFRKIGEHVKKELSDHDNG